VGYNSLSANTSGSNNIAIGNAAASNVGAGSSANIHIGSPGSSADNGTIRIGNPNQVSFFAAGVRGATTGSNDAVAVLIDSHAQLVLLGHKNGYHSAVENQAYSQGI
jgi:hypothetical protein